jgi:multiple sugar transport system substrate-binding protein
VKTRFVAALATCAALGLTACSSSSGGSAKLGDPNDHTPVTITAWNGFTGRELGIVGKALQSFHASHPWITVKNVGGVDDDKIVKAIRGGNAAEVTLSFSADRLGAYCSSGAWIDLAPYIKRDKVDLNQFPTPVQGYSQFAGKRCALPVLSDVYGLYYNTALLKQAGFSAPPKNADELTRMAVKLTKYNADGSIKVAGFVPLWGFYEMAPAHVAPAWGASWAAGSKSTIGQDPHWQAMLKWQKQFVDAIGYAKLRRFTAGAAAGEFSASNFFETGKVAMNIDGEFRTAFLRSEHPELKFGTAPVPGDPSQPDLYGAGYVTGNLVGIPRTATGKKREAAWQLVKYLSTNTDVLVELSNDLRNVPTTLTSLKSPKLTPDPQFASFLTIFANPHTATTPNIAAGSANQDLLTAYVDKYQAGQGGDLQQGLSKVDKNIDDQNAQASGGGAP